MLSCSVCALDKLFKLDFDLEVTSDYLSRLLGNSFLTTVEGLSGIAICLFSSIENLIPAILTV